jgi:DNA polymerase V
MQQSPLNFGHKTHLSPLLSLTYPNKELFQRQHALLRKNVSAGLPTPADDYVERRLTLDDHLVQHKESTFFMRVSGESMHGLGIFDGDLLVVDRSMPAVDGSVVIAAIDDELTLKQLFYSGTSRILRAAHPLYPDIIVKPEQNLIIWGVVQWNVHKV